MGGLARPDMPPGAQRDLVDALHALHHQAGWPSLRALAGQAGCSHTTVSAAFSSSKIPSWGALELIVEAMGGDVAAFHRMWLDASSPASTSGPSTQGAPRIAGRRAEQLLGAAISVPVLGTFRLDDPTIPDPVLAWAARMRRLPNVDTLDLAPLTREETTEQIRMLRVPQPRADEEIDHIYARSRGQPLFTEQLAVDAAGPMPRLLNDVLGQRIADLQAVEQQVTSALAVADRGLPVDVLRPVSGLSAEALTPVVRVLDQRRLLADGNGDDVTLRHPLLAEAVRNRLVPGEAAELHRRLALALATDGEPAEVAAFTPA